jgi:hypothetical protein
MVLTIGDALTVRVIRRTYMGWVGTDGRRLRIDNYVLARLNICEFPFKYLKNIDLHFPIKLTINVQQYTI